MATAPKISNKKVSKSTLSMFLRTRCDKELFLSLHDTRTMGSAGLPIGVKRPGIGTLSVEGANFEITRNDQLVRLFGANVAFNKGTREYNDIDLESILSSLTTSPRVVLQGKFSITQYKVQALLAIGLSATDVADVPDIADFIPDILVVRASLPEDIEVKPDGTRVAVVGQSPRMAIDIFDVKHTSEANPSYCAEIAMYALMLANWLAQKPVLQARFFVTTKAYLWTRVKQGESELERLEAVGGANTTQLLDALVADSEDANLRFYLASVRRFFEDVVRTVRVGDATPGAWTNLEWHVSGSCGSCDWLGDKRHLGGKDRATVDANPSHYCVPAAGMTGHLCLIPGMTKGAKKVLQRNSILDVNALASSAGHPALQEHTMLKRDARHLPTRSAAIIGNTLSSDPGAAIASLVGSANLLLYASVNFDSSSGLLTGLALSGTATAFISGQPPRRFQAVPYIVDQKSLIAEWVALEAFLSQIADCISVAENMVSGTATGQIHFWEARQFTELCNAMGRHLPRVLALTIRKAKALAWVFPPENSLAIPESLEASTVVIVDEIVRRLVFTPTPHVVTLFDTAEHYPSGPIHSVYDSYYREYLSNGIPRERIYEIWANTPQVKRGATPLPRNTVIAQFSDALAKQSRALESVSDRLRRDYKGHFKAKATHIPSKIPTGSRGVAFDGKLWVWWDSLEFNASQLEAHVRLALDGDRLEATYEAIVLTNGRKLSGTLFEFDVAASSTEAKFKEDSVLAIGKLGRPGMPLEHAKALITPGSPAFTGSSDILHAPLWSVLEAKIKTFDRVNARLTFSFECFRDPSLVPYLLANSSVNLLSDIFLLESKKSKYFDWSRTSNEILKEIGNPVIAVPDQNAANAMGISPSTRSGGVDPITAAANVLWNAPMLEAKSILSASQASTIAAYVGAFHGLNPSQIKAVEHGAERALTIVWGPPGTGKTNTLAALLHGLAQHATSSGQSLKILVTGPTYKAVEEVMHRTADSVSLDPSASCSMYLGYSQGRVLGPFPSGLQNNVQYTRMTLHDSDVEFGRCLKQLDENSGVIIVGSQIQQARRFPKAIGGAFVHPTFDVVVIDESSQVPVSKSLSALCGLKPEARLIVAGDHLQMPPIASIEAPAGAEYLVGSIQTYLGERKFASVVPRCELETNYRSNEHIVAFARDIGYPPKLASAYPKTALHILCGWQDQARYPAHLPWCPEFPTMLNPNCMVATLIHKDEVSSQGNAFEAKVIAGAVWLLRNAVSAELDGQRPASHHVPTAKEFWGLCVGIVTPHRAQRALVIRELEKLFPAEKNYIDQAVDTVERFQGGQRHTIFVTFGVGDTDVIGGEEAFLLQMERTNVAVSRAMAKCVVVMPESLATYIPEDKRALKTAFALKDYIGEFCNIRVATTLTDAVETRWAQLRFHR